jgi:hypothetical protein
MKLLNKGFETPTYNTKVINKRRTEVKLPGEGISYNWKPSDGKDDSKFWSNVEYNKYGNGMDTSQFRTPAHLEAKGGNTVIVHAPSDSDLRMITRPDLTLSGISEFLQTNQKEELLNESEVEILATTHFKVKK